VTEVARWTGTKLVQIAGSDLGAATQSGAEVQIETTADLRSCAALATVNAVGGQFTASVSIPSSSALVVETYSGLLATAEPFSLMISC
jgi:hypothetical protein